MYRTLLASDPRTSPEVLRTAASTPNLHDVTAALLLRHDALPDDAVIPDELELPVSDVHDALTDPTLSSAARRRLLDHGETARWNLELFTDLTPAEVDEENARHPLACFDQALAYLRHPATPAPLAQTTLDWIDQNAPADKIDDLTLATYVNERGARTPAFGHRTSWVTRCLKRARRRLPHGTWAQHLSATFGQNCGAWTAIAAATTDPDVGRAALDAAGRMDDVLRAMDVYAKVASNPRLPDDVRVPALVKVGGDRTWFTTSYANGYLSDAGVIQFTAEAAGAAANTVVMLATQNQHLRAATLDTLWSLRSTSIEPRSQLLVALHPNASTDLQRAVADAVPAHEDFEILEDEWCDTLLVLNARLRGPDALLDLPVALLDGMLGFFEAEQRKAVTSLLAAAVATLPTFRPSPLTASAALALEGGFAGTVRDLLAAADATTT